MKFRTKILRGGKTATGIELPVKLVEALGTGKRPHAADRKGEDTRDSAAPR